MRRGSAGASGAVSLSLRRRHRLSLVTNRQEGLCRAGRGGGGVETASSVLGDRVVGVLKRAGSWGRLCLGGSKLCARVLGFLPAPL